MVAAVAAGMNSGENHQMAVTKSHLSEWCFDAQTFDLVVPRGNLVCTAWESVAARVRFVAVSAGFPGPPDVVVLVEVSLDSDDAAVAVVDFQVLADAEYSPKSFVDGCPQELSGAAGFPELSGAAVVVADFQAFVAGSSLRPFVAAEDYLRLFVDAVDQLKLYDAVAEDSAIYYVLVAAAVDWSKCSHCLPALNCSCFLGHVAEGFQRIGLNHKAQN